MKISTKVRYGLRALAYIAEKRNNHTPDKSLSATVISTPVKP